eukprot:GFKZ01010576.1.p1 GENE.GFKZ01010576.1~~GFKZ01010576.1.p1  ORF type:complete len:612 (-),score=-27.55 GFKZ01010576.1:303-2138(-)
MTLQGKTPVLIALIASLLLAVQAMRQCPVGSFNRRGRCQPCAPGTFQNETGAMFCIPCPPGYFNRFPGAQGIDLCEPCPQGTFSLMEGANSPSSCIPCPRGLNSPSGSSRCISCPPGQIISKCDSGFRDILPTGIFGVCADCFRGCFFRPEELKCRPCEAASFAEKENSFLCSPCPIGFSARPGSARCVKCPEGTEPAREGRPCQQCRRGTFKDSTSSSCETCPAGFIPERERGSSRCIPCPEGTARSEEEERCTTCDLGENTNVSGAPVCIPDNTPCAGNFFRNSRGVCDRCSTFQRLDLERMECVPCGENEISEGGLSTTCSECPRGSFASNSFTTFDEGCSCIAGWFKSALPPFECIPCPPGTFNNGNQFFGSNGCGKCQPGSFAPRSGMTRCLKCPPGTAQSLSGQRRCLPCKNGLIPELPSATICVDPRTNCRPGTIRTVSSGGFVFCETTLTSDCPAGTFRVPEPMFNRTFCGSCSTNERFDPERNRCRRCSRGFFSRGGLDPRCRRCRARQFASLDSTCSCDGEVVNGECQRCERGTFIRNRELRCLPCPPGTFLSRRPITFEGCTLCRPGTFSEVGAGRCMRCPPGSTTFGIGESNCVVVRSD